MIKIFAALFAVQTILSPLTSWEPAAEAVEATPSGIIGRLNPTWVEWLMWFPIGWTDLNA